MSEKFITLKEAAQILALTEKELQHYVDKGEISAYQIGGMYLRFKEQQILSLKKEYEKRGKRAFSKKTIPSALEKVSLFTRANDNIKDLFYFNDFYFISIALIAVLIYIIQDSIR